MKDEKNGNTNHCGQNPGILVSNDPRYDFPMSWNEVQYFAEKAVNEPYEANDGGDYNV